MADYQVSGNKNPEELFGGKDNLETIVLMMNQCKEVTLDLCRQHPHQYKWNVDVPASWVELVATEVGNAVMKDKKWRWTPEFALELRRELTKKGLWL